MKKLIYSIFLLSFSYVLLGQGDSKWPAIDASPMDIVYFPSEVAWRNYSTGDQRTATPKMKLVYSRPKMNDREIFGGLVAYGSEWRLGANEATTIGFYQAVGINGKTLQGGSYTLGADVNEDSWTIHFSTETGIWGIANRDKDQTVASITVPTETVEEVTEMLSMAFQKIDDQTVHLVIQWENTRVRIPIALNPVQYNQVDASQMDMTHYPANSAYTNYLKGDDKNITPKITVAYHRPAKKGRKVFGQLVPYGKVWRMGANESTEIVFYQKTTLGNLELNPGRYGLYAEVNEKDWSLIFSKDIPAWGVQNRDETKDVGKVKIATSSEDEVIEHLSIIFEEKTENTVDMTIAWDQTRAVATFTMEK